MIQFTRQEQRVLAFIAVTVLVGGITGLVRRYGVHSDPKVDSKAVLRTFQERTTLTAHQENTPVEKTTKPQDEFININIANRKELESLPTIGPVTAGRIIEFRNANGPFKSTDELKKVKGIGDKTLEKIRPYISL